LPKEGGDNATDFFQKWSFGGGPFYIDSFEPSVKLTLKRNPNFELRDPQYKRPFVDQVDLPVVPDASAREAQFRGGNLFNTAFSATENTLQAKRDLPQLLLTSAYANQPEVLEFGTHVDSPWKDMRVRQAVSMAWNRDDFIVATMSTDVLEDFGIPPNVRWASGLSGSEQGFPGGTYKGYWLDPQGSDFGENAKYFQYHPDESKKLLEAAGFPNGVTADHFLGFGFPTTSFSMDVLNGILAEVGIQLTRKPLDPAEVTSLTETPYPGGGSRNWGNWVGTFSVIDSGGPDPASYLQQMFHKDGGRFRGFNPNSTGASPDGDPTMNSLIEQMFAEFDEPRRIDLAHEFQRYHAKTAYRFRYPGCATTVSVWWPAVQNIGVWAGESFNRQWTNEWIDTSKPPFAA
jgi:ABC-type transport system substrate-binding protein